MKRYRNSASHERSPRTGRRSGPGSPHIARRTEAAEYATHSRAESTLRAYRSDWKAFTEWCREHDLVALPAEPVTVAMYLSDGARTLKASTLRRRLSSIAVAHQTAGLSNPVEDARVKATWAGIRRTHGTAQRGKDPVLIADLRLMVAVLPDSLIGRRDACLLLLGFASALRRSELVALNVEDLSETDEGLIVTVRRSKTDQEGEGREIGVPYGSNPSTCPVRVTRAWLESSGIESGPVLRSVDRHGTIGTTALSEQSGSAHREAHRRSRGARSRQVRRAQSALGDGDLGGEGRSNGSSDHGDHGPPFAHGPAPVYPAWVVVQRERGDEVGSVTIAIGRWSRTRCYVALG